MAQYAINLTDSGGAPLEKSISLTGKALAGLEKQTQDLASAISGLFSSFSLDKVMTQMEKTVKRTTTTVRKQTQKALLSFDEIQRMGRESTSTTSTTSVTTTTEDAANVNALAAAFATLQTAITGALGAVNAKAVVGELSAIRTAAQEILTLYQADVENDIPTWLQGLALGMGITADLIGSAIAVKDYCKKIVPFLDKISGVFSKLGSGILTALESGIPGAIAGVGIFIAGLYDAIVNGLDWLNSVLIPAGATLAGAGIGTIIGMLGGPIGAGIGALIGLVVGLVTDLVILIVQKWDTICAFFSNAATWFYTAVIQPIGNFFVNLWTGVSQWAVSAWESIRAVWGSAAAWFRQNLLTPLSNGFRSTVNGIIGFLNTMIAGIVAGVNALVNAVNKLHFQIPSWVPGLGGKQMGFYLQRVSAPQIPYLAQGAVLPANRPFMAVVGDQRHGTNVEAPLATIQEAVAQVMNDNIAAMMAGFDASVGVQREILEAVLGIQIGDEVIGRAADRYSQKMAVMRGGVW